MNDLSLSPQAQVRDELVNLTLELDAGSKGAKTDL